MDPISAQSVLATAGAAAGETATYVDDVFSTYVYEGTGAAKTITNGINLSGEGGMVWVKNRDDSSHYHVYDTERGVGKRLRTNDTDAEDDFATSNPTSSLTAFNSNGFSVGDFNGINGSNDGIVSWTFRKAPGFFDVVTYTGNSSTRTIAHNLGSVPGMIIIKEYGNSRQWFVYHRSMGTNYNINLDSTAVKQISSTIWNNTAPTSTHFSLGNFGGTNVSNNQYVAYIFAHDDQSFGTDEDEAIIKCGDYTGTGSTGNQINLGFEPQWLLIKNTSTSNTNWTLFDVIRGMPAIGTQAEALFPNTTSAEAGNNPVQPDPTGFTLEGSGSYTNKSGDNYIYMAIRRPHKPPTAGTDVFALDTASASGTTGNAFDAPFPVDMAIEFRWGTTDSRPIAARLTSGKYMLTTGTNTEISSSNITFDSMDGVFTAFDNTDYSAQMFKRAPGFFDVVVYTGTGVNLTLNHNLGVAPELMIVKDRNYGESWQVYASAAGAGDRAEMNRTSAFQAASNRWNNTAPTSSVFTVSTHASVNASGYRYIAFLFATLNGISKVGSYSGTGSNIDVDCGFTAGARFVMIKRTDSTGDWYVWDTAHGIVSGNDPYILLNSAAAQVTSNDYIDPLNAGFTVTSSAPAALNTSGGTYMFLAIA